MSDLRDSGAIEQDTDIIFMLYETMFTKKRWKSVAEVRLVKHEMVNQDLLLSFREELTKFGDLAPEIMNSYAQGELQIGHEI